MAGVSLRCGDCGLLLKSVEEAREHADLTSHSNFSESTEAVLHLVCSACGKPCRSNTEVDLHTKRTGHADFVDKTLEAAKPIELEAERKADGDGSGSGVGGTSLEASEEMVVPKVDEKLLGELVEAMGFSVGRATRALHYSGNSSLEGAVNWIVEHENDPDIDDMPMVPNIKDEAERPSLTPDEIKLKAQELRDRARKKKEEEEKKMEREREKERIRIGKELLEAKRIEEENERKRILALRKAEKEEEKRAREKIRQRLEEDKAERRRKLGLPPEDPQAAKTCEAVAEEKKSSLPVKPATKTEQLRDCLRLLKHNHKEDDAKVKRAFQTLLTYIGNVARNSNEEKFRKIRVSNPSFQERVGSLNGGIQFLELIGFEKVEADEFLYLPQEKVDMAVLHAAGSELNSAMNNPFFGVL